LNEATLASSGSVARVLVVGAGIGGLVAALLLAHRGLRVQVLEAAAAPGGKIRQVLVGGQSMDAGPTVLTMRWVLEHVFRQAGSSLDRHLRLSPLSVLARHAWGPDERSERLDLYADPARTADAIGVFSGAREARRFLDFCAEARQIYTRLEGPCMRSQRPGLASMMSALGPAGLARLAALGPLTSLWSVLGRRFADPRLRQLFGRYATYCGASPWAAPATLVLLAQVELDGVWAVEGGMQAVAQAVAGLAVERGVEFSYGTPAHEIIVGGGRARGVRSADGREWPADAVIFNGDSDALAQGLLGGAVRGAVKRRAAAERSLSALTCSVLARTEGFPLVRHNVFFHPDYASEFEDVFGRQRLPRAGTVYLCAHDRGDPGPGPGGAERMLLLVNAPADGDRVASDSMEIERCEQTSLSLLGRCGLRVERNAANWVRTTPEDYHRLFPGTGGALYGTATHGWMTVFRRPGSTTRVPGLYLAGGSAHPGPGVPMAAMSGSLAAEMLLADLGSTSRSSRAAIGGGISTRSATTVGTA
jgi:1-hydroxycarotenoid 3,4-desaturase